jgi:hypothetical protein
MQHPGALSSGALAHEKSKKNMSYENPLTISHSLPAITVGAVQTQSIKGPAGKRGVVRSVAVSVTTSVVGAGTKVDVGVAGALAKFMTLLVGAQTAPEALATDVQTRDATTKVIAEVGKDEEVLITHAAGTSGVYATTVTVDYY